jgi:hypothetical protein
MTIVANKNIKGLEKSGTSGMRKFKIFDLIMRRELKILQLQQL